MARVIGGWGGICFANAEREAGDTFAYITGQHQTQLDSAAKKIGSVLCALCAALVITQAVGAESKAYPTVTDDRLVHPDPGDWLMYRRTYDGSGFSPLKQITPSNVHKLSLAWSLSTDLVEAHETTPIVNHGRMFITTPGNNIIALDGKTGTQLWRYVRKYPDGLFQLHPTNRGVALYGDRVYMATTDCALVALDAASGKEVWTVPIDNYKTGCYSTLAPLAVRGKIIVGYSGGEFGVRGSVSAFDALNGKRIWQTYTVPAPAAWRQSLYGFDNRARCRHRCNQELSPVHPA